MNLIYSSQKKASKEHKMEDLTKPFYSIGSGDIHPEDPNAKIAKDEEANYALVYLKIYTIVVFKRNPKSTNRQMKLLNWKYCYNARRTTIIAI